MLRRRARRGLAVACGIRPRARASRTDRMQVLCASSVCPTAEVISTDYSYASRKGRRGQKEGSQVGFLCRCFGLSAVAEHTHTVTLEPPRLPKLPSQFQISPISSPICLSVKFPTRAVWGTKVPPHVAASGSWVSNFRPHPVLAPVTGLGAFWRSERPLAD
jgi:hypothetical protein